MTSKWDERFIRMAELVGSWSKDPNGGCGAVITGEERIVYGVGFNGFPRGVVDYDQRLDDRDVKLKLIVHAEANAILNSRTNLRGATLYCTRPPCSECAKLIIQSGIRRVVCCPLSPNSKWLADLEITRMMFDEARVRCEEIVATPSPDQLELEQRRLGATHWYLDHRTQLAVLIQASDELGPQTCSVCEYLKSRVYQPVCQEGGGDVICGQCVVERLGDLIRDLPAATVPTHGASRE